MLTTFPRLRKDEEILRWTLYTEVMEIDRIYPERRIIHLRRIIRLSWVDMRRIKWSNLMRLGNYETHQTDFFRSLTSVLRHRLNLPSSNSTFSCTCRFFKLLSNFLLICSKLSLCEDFFKLEFPGPPENPPHSQKLLQTLLVLKSSQFVHLLSFLPDNSFFLVAILINKTYERFKKASFNSDLCV